ncbi:peptidase associated/transthyretin-like domain-containing protein [Albibacterium indicum]|uniref:hypothetical protein n=1 Tax=Albibacterium indicum TaxID=2292082 RepID=UPI000E52FEA3|nr:hypothetical protein [Pedobacter indicus]
MKFCLKTVFVLIIVAFSLGAHAQEEPTKKLVQFTGIIQNVDSNVVVPYVTIRNISYRDQFFASNHQGYFSFVAHEKDTIEFTAIGYKTTQVVIPESENNRHSGIVKMEASVTALPVVVVLPWASVEEFNQAFLALDVADDDYLLAKRNLSRESLVAMAREAPLSANELQNYQAISSHQNMTNRNINQRYANPLLNPFAWAKFIDQISKGSKK